jgi:streptogramin lyase
MTLSTRYRTARDRRRSADRTRARPRPEGLEDRCLLAPTITEFPVPTANALLGNANGITAGPDGNLWFAEDGASKIGMINPTTHAFNEFATPTANAGPRGITAGPDGNLWFTEFKSGSVSKIGMINPATDVISEFATPTANAGPFGIAAGPDGNLWFTELQANKIGEINPTNHAISEFPVPAARHQVGAAGEGIGAGPDGNIWFSGGGIGMINPTTHAISEFPIPSGNGAEGISAGPDGNIWFADPSGDKIGMINPATDVISEFAVPTAGADPSRITAGPDGNLWFDGDTGILGEINPTTHAISDFPIPYTNTGPFGITSGPDGNVWFEDAGSNAIGVVTLVANADHFVVTQLPPSSITAGSPFGVTVQADDRSGNLDPSFNGTVYVALANNSGGTTLGGTPSVTASGGVATFSGLSLTTAAIGYTLQVSASGVDSVTTSAITVNATTATQLVITQQPPSTVGVNSTFGMQASIEDVYGNVVTSASGPVSVAFASNPTGATLGGTLTMTASGGVASFTNLTINKIGSGYTLLVSSSGLSSATSNPINVSKHGNFPVKLNLSTGTNTTDLSLAPLVLDSPDLWDGWRFRKLHRST